MRTGTFTLALLLAVGLSSCGGSRVATPAKKEEKKDEITTVKTEPMPVAPAAPPRTAPVTAPSARQTTPAGQGSTKPPAAGDTRLKPPGGDAGFGEGMIGGKHLGTWITLLDSKNKDEVIEAINACKIARGKAASAVPKLTELSNSPEKDIASEAASALKVIAK